MGLEISYQFPQKTEISDRAYIGEILVSFGCQFKAWESTVAKEAAKEPMLKEITVSWTPEAIKRINDMIAEECYKELKSPPTIVPEREETDKDGGKIIIPAYTIYTNSLNVDLSTAKDMLEEKP